MPETAVAAPPQTADLVAFTMPSLGADMEEGTVTEWRVKVGDTVHRGDIVALVDTEKSTIDVEVFRDGVMAELVVPEGETVPVGTVLALIAPLAARHDQPAPDQPQHDQPAPDQPAPDQPQHDQLTPDQPQHDQPTPEPVSASFWRGNREPGAPNPRQNPAATRSGALYGVPARPPQSVEPTGAPIVSPIVRHLAEQLGVDVRHLSGTGPGHSISRHDVEEAARHRPMRPRSSPYGRRMARALSIDLSAITGTGPGGAITAGDVQRSAAAQHAPAPSAARLTQDKGDKKASMRQAIANLMARSKREIPHYYLSTTIDMGAAVAWLRAENEQRAVADRLLPVVVLLAATARAAREVPEVNGHWVDGTFRAAAGVRLGMVVSQRGGGLLVPSLASADERSVDELSAAMRDVVQRARSGRLRSSELADPSITVTNLGDLGVDEVLPVIYPPQVAIVGFGRVAERPWVVEGQLSVRPIVRVTLAADHRASDGMTGARFLAAVDRLLQHPEAL